MFRLTPVLTDDLNKMDYTGILGFIKERKPYLQVTLENTTNENAVRAREVVERIYEGI